MKEWTVANRQAAQDALKVAVNALHDAALGKMQVLAEGRLGQVERVFARRAPQGERWQRLLEKARSLESQSARLHGTIDSLKLAQYPLSDIANGWLDLRGWTSRGKSTRQVDDVHDPHLGMTVPVVRSF
jgi:hypothetical protein